MPDRVYSFYRRDQKTIDWLNITPTVAQPLFNTAHDVRRSYDIDTGTTYELDVIGRIVGLNRNTDTFLLMDSQGYGNLQYGDGQYYGAGQFSDLNAANDVFKLLLKAKIAKNIGNGSHDNIVEALTILVPGSKPKVIDNDDWTFSVEFDIHLNDIQRHVLNTFDVLPRPQGVKFTGFTEA